ncbi:unnamed protein product, partial [Ectocarpus fasciculatus]
VPLAYCIAADRYYMHDHVGQVYQMCVARKYRRLHIGANLLAKVWATWPRGVKLCGCWCAQDLEEANSYWEQCGFTAVAFRAASRNRRVKGKSASCTSGGGVHIYWQRPIRGADYAQLREGHFRGWWMPYETRGGLMGE